MITGPFTMQEKLKNCKTKEEADAVIETMKRTANELMKA